MTFERAVDRIAIPMAFGAQITGALLALLHALEGASQLALIDLAASMLALGSALFLSRLCPVPIAVRIKIEESAAAPGAIKGDSRRADPVEPGRV